MARNPLLSGVWPIPDETSVPLKPTIRLTFMGPGLVDPKTWFSGTFALYGPGDVVYETGPGTILNSGIQTDPYALLDGAIIRERIPGAYQLYTSGLPPVSGVIPSGYLGISGSRIIAEFSPSVPLNPYTQYTAVLVGANGMAWSNSTQSFAGVTSWTSNAQFSGVGTTGSGVVSVLQSYGRTLPSILYDEATGYNDTYRIVISSGSVAGSPKFSWSQDSSPGTYIGEGTGPHDLGEGLVFQFSGLFVTSEEYRLDVYIPEPLEDTYVWNFSTSEISGNTPPVAPVEPPLVIDQTPGGGFAPVPLVDTGLHLVETTPPHMAYAVDPTTGAIVLEFDREVADVDATKIQIIATSLMGMPNATGTGIIVPTAIAISGKYVTLHLI